MINETAFLIIHGFGGNSSEINSLAEYLRNNGATVSCPPLKGHDGNRKSMAGISRKDWILSCEVEYLRLAKDFESIIIIGFSTGGLIAINLAIKYPIKAIITISTPIYVWNLKQVFKNITIGSKSERMKSLRWYLYSATSFPISALLQFQILLHKTKSLLLKITCPICILQGLDDDTVNSKSASYIYKKVSSPIKKLHFLEKAGHVVLKGPAAKDAIKKIQEFLDSISVS
jgi:carboxylesterase